ncbi:acetyl-CoA C-acyltransferase [Planctomyces sp. SH-PL14]|uniref:acetyl-CoA C-acyltransferase n=1 Tax=Planctomyces sp. SH-PL14 TaxID=1632864 RepID=UPI00078C36B0|nr:acetyl-CoA C-acyltransferase [Planctomyces sp. SH-PL14]AMV18944.1 Acetyl-CoA acetyltransferase [Planctomyces sp. SH-PL14]
MSDRVWIVSAKRTPQGRFLGALAKKTAVDLGVAAAKAALATIEPQHIESVIVGNVLGAGLGMNVARQIGIHSGIPIEVPAFTVNMMCASGMQAVILAVQAIRARTARVVLCGGTESMSNAPFLLNGARSGWKFGDGTLIDSIQRDGLTDAFSGEAMGLIGERIAAQYAVSREQQDEFAARSQQRYAEALAQGRYRDEIAAIDGLDRDEPPRPETNAAGLAKLRPSFKPDGTVTAGNASGINDGAAMLVVCDPEWGQAHDLTPLAVITATASVGCDPALMGMGPVYATRKVSRSPAEFDHVELNEAFAAQAVACAKELELSDDRVNPDGGAIALGHPIGASGARLIVHLAHRRPKKGLATLCVGGGQGCAVVVEQP